MSTVPPNPPTPPPPAGPGGGSGAVSGAGSAGAGAGGAGQKRRRPRRQIPRPSDWSEARKVDKHQNPWAVMIDYTKTVITLATAVLGLTVTFAGTLVGANPTPTIIHLIGAAWVFLIVTIALALYVVGKLTGYLRGLRRTTHPAGLMCNLCYGALLAAMICFAIAGYLRMYAPAPAPAQTTGYLKKLGNIGPFDSGAVELCPPKHNGAACDSQADQVFAALPVAQMPSPPQFLFLVGSADRERLTQAALRIYGSNAGLARGRSEWVAQQLARRYPQVFAGAQFIPLYTGSNPFEHASQPDSPADRRVEIWAGSVGK